MDKSPNFKPIAAAAAILFIALILTRNFYAAVFPLHQPESDSYLEAAELTGLAPPECVFLTSYRVWNHLRYYFDRDQKTIQAKHPMGYFYQYQPLPEQYQLKQATCILVKAQYVTPGFTLTDYAAANGYNAPSEWLAYMEWLFNFEYDSNHTLVAGRKFELIALDEGDPYLLLSSSRMEVNGLDGLFQSLDNQINGHLGRETNPFQTWLATAYRGS
jgi:hypothetical protein